MRARHTLIYITALIVQSEVVNCASVHRKSTKSGVHAPNDPYRKGLILPGQQSDASRTLTKASRLVGRSVLASVKPRMPKSWAAGGLLTPDERRRLHEYAHTNPFAFKLCRTQDVDHISPQDIIENVINEYAGTVEGRASLRRWLQYNYGWWYMLPENKQLLKSTAFTSKEMREILDTVKICTIYRYDQAHPNFYDFLISMRLSSASDNRL